MSRLFSTILILSLVQIYKSQSLPHSPSGALLYNSINHNVFNKTFNVAPSTFGYSESRGSVEGTLVLPVNETYHTACLTSAQTLDINPYIHYIKDWFIHTNDITSYILIVDRGDCYFVDKAKHAQSIGASGVIICDTKSEALFSMWTPEDWSDNINIPAVLLSNHDCAALMQSFGVQNWDPFNPQNMKYPTAEKINWITSTIQWGLPRPNDKVIWSFWTSANDIDGSKFRENFYSTAISLNNENATMFTPHMYILNGSHWGCDEADFPCKTQCSNSGRYCAVDPEYDMSIGLDGIDVVQENLRSLCVWEFDKDNFGVMKSIMWWDYSSLWDTNCGVLATDISDTFNEACSYKQMDQLDSTGKLKSYVQTCVINSGGYNYTCGENTILSRELRFKTYSSVYSIPLVNVNDFQIKDPVCTSPITKTSCKVLETICNGFSTGTEPHICSNNVPISPSPTIENELECNYGVNYTDFYETYIMDSCYNLNPVQFYDPLQLSFQYECDFISGNIKQHIWKNERCFEHANQTNDGYIQVHSCDANKSDKQCNNFVWLNQFMKQSSICAPHEHTIVKYAMIVDKCISFDVDNTAFKNIYTNIDIPQIIQFQYDNINECNLDKYNNEMNTLAKNILYFSSGTCHNNKYYYIQSDTIETYAPTPKPTYKGCSGDAKLDMCGQCLSQSDPHFFIQYNSCVGCDGVVNSSKVFNSCGQCVLSTDPNFSNYGKDCSGVCVASASNTHYIDECGQCLLTSDPKWNSCMRQTTSYEPSSSIATSYEPSYEPSITTTSNEPSLVIVTPMPTIRVSHPTWSPILRHFETSNDQPTKQPTTTTKQPTTTTNNLDSRTENEHNGVSMIAILCMVIGILVLILCLCGFYIIYVKYQKNKVAADYVANIMAVEGEGDVNLGEKDYEEPSEGDILYVQSHPSTALAQTSRL